MKKIRVDNRGRNLNRGEYQKADGRYEFRYIDHNGEPKSIYSWRLVDTDKMPVGKHITDSLREMEKVIIEYSEQIRNAKNDNTLDSRFQKNIKNRNLNQSTRANYIYMYEKFISPELGHLNIKVINRETISKFVRYLLDEMKFNPRTVEIVCNILKPVFREAISSGFILLNPIEGIMTEIRKDNRWSKRDYSIKNRVSYSYVYRYVDKHDNKTKYIGIVYRGNLKDRILRHKKDYWNNNSEWKIQYFQVNNRSEAEAIESHLIALHATNGTHGAMK